MPVLVDGNNLIFAARDVEDPDRLVGRAMLCAILGAWARRRGERVMIVFDGPTPARELAEQIAGADVEVSYSGAGVTADDALIRALEAYSAPRRLVVVSTDREIARAARRRRATAVTSAEFWRRVRADLSRSEAVPREPDEKRNGLSDNEAEDWLRDLGLSGEGGV